MERIFKRRNAAFSDCTTSEPVDESLLTESGSRMEESSMDSSGPSTTSMDSVPDSTVALKPSVLCRTLFALRGSSARSSLAGRFLREY